MKKFKYMSIGLCLVTALLFAGCTSSKVDGVERILGTYDMVKSSQIYPSRINAFELEQNYSKWEVFMTDKLVVSGIQFNAAKITDDAVVLMVRVDLQQGDKLTPVKEYTEITFDKYNNIQFDESIEINRQKGETQERQILCLTFKNNSEIKFKLYDFKLTIN